ncbi:hydrogenase maturation protease [Paludibacterium denitrificans]|uniref:Hydrogenase maturation protease n=1 Tax=Paludibacterium denitrificans TaxID=2675226 RepID=A0A844GFZ6_9NEIS|nr:hydrogenase maturation protease [Paludibacterium denitrificans]MTD34148.1 hydrogenase maturation protease [Paludibacterium denitrificans]
MSAIAPLLVIGIGNPSRGDDAIGPLLAERLQRWLAEHAINHVEVLSDFQLNIEQVLDLAGRQRVLFIDASVNSATPFACERVSPIDSSHYSTHSVLPQQLLALYQRLMQQPAPPTELLTIQGEAFELGQPPSDMAQAGMAAAWPFLCQWCTGTHRTIV